MFTHALLLLLFIVFPETPAAETAAYTPVDLILLNCGEPSNAKDNFGRSWLADESSKYAPANATSISNSSLADHSPTDTVPYSMARVIHSPLTYSIPVSSGHKFIRLYFYADSYAGYNTSQSYFSVTANGYTLLSNFSALLHSLYLGEPSFMKEFLIKVEGDQRIGLTFSPNPKSFAFINGIEIVSIPDTLYFRNKPIKSVPDHLFDLQNDTAFEKLHRLNVGGSDVQVPGDTGMFRYWTKDDKYIFGADSGYTPADENHTIDYTPDTPSYSAPKIVYRTSRTMANTSRSLEWGFPVDSGFNYMLRFHFCEIQLEVTHQNERVFTINIDNKTAELEADVIAWTGSTGIPIFKDYITWVPDDGSRGKKDLRLSLFPRNEAQPLYSNALLNGLEIFKLSDDKKSLSAANPSPAPPNPSSGDSPRPAPREKKGVSAMVYAIVGSVIGVTAVVAAVSFFIFRRRQKVKDSISTKSSWVPLPAASRATTRSSGSGTRLPSDLCRHFTLEEIMAATGNFDDNSIIGKGGFGNVYKGFIDNNTVTVAVKRLNATSNQGAREFLTEIEMLSQLRHLHLVSLIGYCDDAGEMILVYDYMEHGTLRDHLYKSERTPLKWKDRLEICVGAARGLQYLHTGVKHPIIHRDVKSTNILLDEKWMAKMSDFGLSKIGSTDDTHVSTAVKGSIGYVDPEYYKLQQLTDKSDVYSFGVVLFEVLCGRPAVVQTLPREKLSLVEWAKACYKRGTIEEIIDPNLEGQIAPECLSKFVETAITCVREKGIERPSMSDVVWSLEFSLQLHAEWENGGSSLVSPAPEFPLLKQKDPNSTDDEMFWGTSETATWSKSSGLPSSGSSEKLNSRDIFSEIKNPTGR